MSSKNFSEEGTYEEFWEALSKSQSLREVCGGELERHYPTREERIGTIVHRIFSEMGEYELSLGGIFRELEGACNDIIKERVRAELHFAKKFIQEHLPHLLPVCNLILTNESSEKKRADSLRQLIANTLGNSLNEVVVKKIREFACLDEECSGLTAIPYYIRDLTFLEALTICEASLKKIEHLPRRLESLTLEDHQIEEIENLPPLLEYLNLGGNWIRVVKHLPIGLKMLFLNDNEIERIEALPPFLEEADFSQNKLSVIKGLSVSLKRLNVEDNPLLRILELPPLLEVLHIDRCKLGLLGHIPPNLKIFCQGEPIASKRVRVD